MTDNSLAFGRPGMPPRWTSSSKEGIGTAYAASSRVWFTVSHGILNEIYYPTIDRPQTRDMEFLITDGESFFHEEKRDLRTEIDYVQHHTLGYVVNAEDPGGRYRLTKEIIADPHQDCVLIHTRFEPAQDWTGRLQLYALLAPHLDVGGWGNSACRTEAAGRTIILAWKHNTFLAFGANVGFVRASCGYAGSSDGWQDLRADYRMDWEFERAEDGNIAVMGQIDVAKHREFTVAIGFGDSQLAAISALTQSLALRFAEHKDRYIDQWHRTSCDMPGLAQCSCDDGRLYRISHSLMLAHEDKSIPGAFIASASIPWGEAMGDEDLGGYHLVWTRDLVHTASSLLVCTHRTPQRALVYLACTQHADGGFPQNFWIDGTAYWRGLQLDEVAFPILLAWRVWKAGALAEFDPYPTVRAGATFLILQGPVTEQERWEENSGYSPSTLAATIAGLICAADFARSRGDDADAAFIEDYADFLESHVERWTVTTDGALVSGIPRHYTRIHPAAIDDPCPDEDPNHGVLPILNRPPGEQGEFPAKDIVDPGFIDLVRLSIRPPGDRLIEDSLEVVDRILKVDTPFGPCWHRYNHDGYGQRSDGGPFLGWGKGRAWPLLTGERAHYELAAGRDPRPYLRAMEQFASRGGMLPEQVWDEPDRPEDGLYFGKPTGSAMPLVWAHAEYLKLLRSAADGQVFDSIPPVAARYLGHRGRNDLEVWNFKRQVRQMNAGGTLRIQARVPFRLHWTANGWHNALDVEATPTSLGIYYVDLRVPKDQRAPIQFTFFWPEPQRWEGRDYAVRMI